MSDFLCKIWKVKHGSAAFIVAPNKKTIMLDCGSSPDFSPAEHLSKQYKVSKLDNIVISHPHADHISDLPTVISKLSPRTRTKNPHTPNSLVFPKGTEDLSEPHKSWHNMNLKFTKTTSVSNKLAIPSNFGGLAFKTFRCKKAQLPKSAQDNLNNYSLVTVVRYKHTEIIFPGDLEPLGWEALFKHSDLAANVGKSKYKVLVAPHHGRKSGIRYSDDSLYKGFMEALEPNLVIISDKWGSETTAPEDYRPLVHDGLIVDGEIKKVLTTKTVKCVSIKCDDKKLTIKTS